MPQACLHFLISPTIHKTITLVLKPGIGGRSAIMESSPLTEILQTLTSAYQMQHQVCREQFPSSSPSSGRGSASGLIQPEGTLAATTLTPPLATTGGTTLCSPAPLSLCAHWPLATHTDTRK